MQISLEISNPFVASQWHPTKNGLLGPGTVSPNSNKKVWWQCKKNHEWLAVIGSRNKGAGCPYCSGRLATFDNCLEKANPGVTKEWDWVKNHPLTPKNVTPNSNKKVWWKCKKGHEWLTSIANRNYGYGCPYCSNQLVHKDNSLLNINPSLAKEWHPLKNNSLTAQDVTPGSTKKVWWLCKKSHEWQAIIGNRSKGSGCPYCYGRFATDQTCLQAVNSILAEQWHPTKNGKLTPRDVKSNSTNKVWWLCNKGHEWRAKIGNRSNGRNCPFCSNRISYESNCLETTNPLLAKEWHPTKNGTLTTKKVVPNSGKKVWWQCVKGHEWKARIADRNKGNRCPFCYSNTSLIELRIFTEIKYLFPESLNRKKILGVECDIFIPNLKTGIEIDGFYWHKNKYPSDKRKNDLLKKHGFELFRLREEGLRKISKSDIITSLKDTGFDNLKKVLMTIVKIKSVKEFERERIEKYLAEKKLRNNEEFLRLLYTLPSSLPGHSLFDLNKPIALQWHPTKNGSLTPAQVAPNSHKKVWWLCQKGHEWQANISKRNLGRGCPFCSNKKTDAGNCLKKLRPDLAQEWHPTRNLPLTPYDVVPNSNKKIWWLCNKQHEWQAVVATRTRGNGCPYCSNRLVDKDNCLQKLNPSVALQWHPTKNGPLTPSDIIPGSSKKVWWLCKKGHEWNSTVINRHRGSGCPTCSRKKRYVGDSK